MQDYQIGSENELDIAAEITIEETVENQTENIDLDSEMCESAQNIADNSMGDLVGDVSFDGSVSGHKGRTKHVGGRKRTRNQSNWQRNIDKKKCNTGQKYVNSKGRTQRAKKMGRGCGEKCRFRCHTAFTERDREEIFDSYWRLGDVSRQRQFLLKFSAPQNKKSKKQSVSNNNRERKLSYMWALPLNGKRVRVCKSFFLHTLNISSQKIILLWKKLKISQAL